MIDVKMVTATTCRGNSGIPPPPLLGDECVPNWEVEVFSVDVLTLTIKVGVVCVDLIALEAVVDVVMDNADAKPIVVVVAPVTLREPVPFATEYPEGGMTVNGYTALPTKTVKLVPVETNLVPPIDTDHGRPAGNPRALNVRL